MDQRTRERLPVLPVLVRTANDRRLAAARLPGRSAGGRTRARSSTAPHGALRKAFAPKAIGRFVWAEDVATGKRRNLILRGRGSVLGVRHHRSPAADRHPLRGTARTVSHHSITEYRLPSTGELVPLLQIAPSKTDTERLLLVSPELADVLSAIVQRLARPRRCRPAGGRPTTSGRESGTRRCRCCSSAASATSAAPSPRPRSASCSSTRSPRPASPTPGGDPLVFHPHDFRRIFVTDAIMNGLPPHIAQVICGHKTIGTTMGV